jgi:hypothetical protein
MGYSFSPFWEESDDAVEGVFGKCPGLKRCERTGLYKMVFIPRSIAISIQSVLSRKGGDLVSVHLPDGPGKT